tara:strand:- start:231 stop:503 length:273 start_codon:yes stop_codon:yes gene_type:complete
MKIKAIHMNELLEKNDDLYENIVVAAKRARQIIDSRAIDFDALEDVEDSDVLDKIQPIFDEELEKPMVVALNEFFEDELEWRNPNKEESK